MTRWKKGETEFTVKVNYNDARGWQSSIPKPVMEALGEPEALTFTLNGKKVELKAGKANRP